MKTVKLFKNEKFLSLSTVGKEYSVSQEIYDKIITGDYLIELIDGQIVVTLNENAINAKKEAEIERIKNEYNKIILDKYPYYSQINLSAEIQEIHLLARQEDRIFTEAEMLKVGEAKEMKDWIFSMREECNEKIAAL